MNDEQCGMYSLPFLCSRSEEAKEYRVKCKADQDEAKDPSAPVKGTDRQAMESNHGLNVGDIVTEVRSHPYIKGGNGLDFWDFKHETLHFEIIETLRHEYKVRYIDIEDSKPFYWPFWDEQPNYGFMPNGCSTVRYYAPHTNG